MQKQISSWAGEKLNVLELSLLGDKVCKEAA